MYSRVRLDCALTADMCEVQRASVLYVLFPILEAGKAIYQLYYASFYLAITIIYTYEWIIFSATVCVPGGGQGLERDPRVSSSLHVALPPRPLFQLLHHAHHILWVRHICSHDHFLYLLSPTPLLCPFLFLVSLSPFISAHWMLPPPPG